MGIPVQDPKSFVGTEVTKCHFSPMAVSQATLSKFGSTPTTDGWNRDSSTWFMFSLRYLVAVWVVLSTLLFLSALVAGHLTQPYHSSGVGQTLVIATQPATVTPIAIQAETGSSESTQEPATGTTAAAATTQSTLSAQKVLTTTATLEAEAQPPTTYTARVHAPAGSLLDRLTYNKPSIWGNKAFYVGLAVIYVVLLVLLFRLLLQLGQQDEGR
jgi:hypothetical protein